MTELLYEVQDKVAVITLNRPEKLNTFTTEMLHAWADALLESQRRDDVRAIVVTGAGRAFCAGGDVGTMDDRKDDGPLARKVGLQSRVYRVPLALLEVDKPVLVAVNGAATGAGMDMALMGDIRLAARSARFAETYVRIGIMAGDGGAWYLPRLIGMPRALELLWTGRFVESDEAERIGLVNAVVEDDLLMSTTLEMASRIAAGPPLAIRFMKRAAYQGATMDLRSHLDQVSSHMGLLFATQDHKEAVAAFRERRPQYSPAIRATTTQFTLRLGLSGRQSLAGDHAISRMEQDAFAFNFQVRAGSAILLRIRGQNGGDDRSGGEVYGPKFKALKQEYEEGGDNA